MSSNGVALLLRRSDHVFYGLSDAELHDRLCGDLDRFAGLRIAADAGFALRFHEAAKTTAKFYLAKAVKDSIAPKK